jgi:hypothetical protein
MNHTLSIVFFVMVQHTNFNYDVNFTNFAF